MDPADHKLPAVRTFIGEADQISGAFDHINPRNGLRGWLVQPARTNAPLRVEAWCHGHKLAETLTVLDRPGIDNILKRKTNCGFLLGWSRFDVAALSRVAAATPEAEIVVQVGGTGQRVPASSVSLTAQAALHMVQSAPRGDRVAQFDVLNDYLEVDASGLFDSDWYGRQYGDEIADQGLPLLHYLRQGEAEGKRPNLYFDPTYYAQHAQVAPNEPRLLHYLRRDDRVRGTPGVHFDPAWYRAKYRLNASDNVLAHYLAHRTTACPNGVVTSRMLGKKPATDPYEAFLRARALRRDAFKDAPDGLKVLLTDAMALFADAPDAPADEVAPNAGLAQADDPMALLRTITTLDQLTALVRDNPAARVAQAAPLDALVRAAVAVEAGQTVQAAEAFSQALADLRTTAVKTGYDAAPLLHSVLAWGHRQWHGAGSAALLHLFQDLRAAGIHDHPSIIRILEASVAARDLAASETAALDLSQLYPEPPSGWVLIALARFHMLRGDAAQARAALRQIPPPPASDLAMFCNALILLIELGDLSTAKAGLAPLHDRLSPELQIARIRLALRTQDWPALTAALRSADPAALPLWVLCEAAFLSAVPGKPQDPAQIEADRLIIAALDLSSTTSEPALLAQLHLLIQRRLFGDLDLLFDRIKGLALADKTSVLVRRLEFLGKSGRTAEALALYQANLSATTLGKWEAMTAISVLGETRDWDATGALILNHIRQGFGFGGAVHAALRGVRKAHLHEKIATLAQDGAINPVQDADLAPFLALVHEDHTLVQSARAINGQGDFSQATLNRIGQNWMLANAQSGTDQKSCLFLCSNRRYFLSLLTFLCSYFGQSHQSNAVVYVFLDRDVRPAWHSAITLLATRFNRTVEIVAEDGFMPGGVAHKADYGFFSGGGGLSRAAYFRLYAARFLMAKGRFSRSVYVDTDIVCRGDLTGLFDLDLKGAPLAARIEDFGPEIKTAAESNGLDPNSYFNSGVLVLDFDHADLHALLDRAITLSEHEPERLFFHDQCALNIAFAHRFHSLPDAYNFFLRPHRDRNGHIEDGILLHYLDKPKPWNISFTRNYREEWRIWAVQLSMILPQTQFVDIFAAANEE